MALKKITKITKKQIAEKGVQALADRPNLTAQYGASGLSAAQLKLWFDKLATFLAERINEISDAISSDEAAKYIRVCLDDLNIDNLDLLITALNVGDFASKVLRVYPAANSKDLQFLQTLINKWAEKFSQIDNTLLCKIDKKNDKQTIYAVDINEEQKNMPYSCDSTGETIAFRGLKGQLRAKTMEDGEDEANEDDLINRQFFTKKAGRIQEELENLSCQLQKLVLYSEVTGTIEITPVSTIYDSTTERLSILTNTNYDKLSESLNI